MKMLQGDIIKKFLLNSTLKIKTPLFLLFLYCNYFFSLFNSKAVGVIEFNATLMTVLLLQVQTAGSLCFDSVEGRANYGKL